MAQLIKEKSRFFERYYSADELDELKKRGFPAKSAAPTAAGMFCAKEAFSKALGTGVVGFSLNEVSLLHKPNGMPYLCLSGRAKQLADAQKLRFSVSISHTDTLANAVVIAFCE